MLEWSEYAYAYAYERTNTPFTGKDILFYMKKHTTKLSTLQKTAAGIGGAVVVLASATDFFAGNYLVNYAIGRSGDGGERNISEDADTPAEETQSADTEEIINASKKKMRSAAAVFEQAHPAKDVTIQSTDNLNLYGAYYKNEDAADKHLWAIVIHGYRGDHTGMIEFSERYYENGYQVVAPDLRACGKSEGDYVGMGWLDRLDIVSWIHWIVEQDPDAKIVLHGVSMGAATVMMTSGEELPDNVKIFIEDCGYTSTWEIFASELKLRFHLPEFPLMQTASLIASNKAGYNFKEANSLNAVVSCEKPMLFIHGTADDFIPYSMMDKLYEAKPGTNKATLTAEGAGHADSLYLLGDKYWNTVFDFIDEYMK